MSAVLKEKEQPVEAVGPLQITKEKLRDWSDCTDGYQWFLKKFPQGAAFGEVYAELRADRRYADSDWLTERVFCGLGAVDMTRELVSITGANREKIAEQVKKDGGAEGAAATTGDWANAATTGKHAVAVCLGFNSKAMAGEDGAVVLKWWDEKANRPRLAIGYVGENGIKAGTWYSVSDTGELVEDEGGEAK